MSTFRERQLIERQDSLWSEMTRIRKNAEDEERDFLAEERGNFDKASAELDVVLEDLKREQDFNARESRLNSVDLDQVVDTRTGGIEIETPEERTAKRDAQYARAFDAYARGGAQELNTEQRNLLLANSVDDPELRAQATTSGGAGGYLIPPGYRAIIIEKMKAFGGLLNYATVINTSTGNPLQWPTVDDTGNVGVLQAEGTTVSPVSLTFGTATLGAYMYTSGIVLASLQILQDSIFPLDTWLPEHLGTRIGRKVAADLISGTGSSQPLGVATNAPVKVTGAAGFGITYNNLIDLEHSLDPAYRQNCRFLMNDTTLSVIRKIVDGYGRPLWVPVPVPGMAPTINGQPYAIDQGMAAPGASTKSILFGDFARAYLVRHVLDMQMVRFGERYMDLLQVGFMAFTRLDATLQDSSAVGALQHGAS
ncbi:MAG: family phage major capsid protein [Nocardioides sp.]|nr:family phage major capsid protein [Nocardioides sp.]